MQAAENSASQSVGLADDGTLYFNVDYEYHYHSSYLDENEEPIEGLNHEWQLFKLDGSGLDTTGNVALLSGAYDDDPMLESGIQYEHHLQSTAQGDELSIGLYVPYNAPGNLPTSGGGSIRTYHYSGFYQLRAMVREAGTGDDIVVSPLDYNLGNIYHAFGNLTHPVIVTQGYDNTMLVFHDGNYTRQNLTADPRTGERAELTQITDRGNGLSSNATNPFWYNGKSFPQAMVAPALPEFSVFAFVAGILVGNLSGNVVLAGNVCVDPVWSHDISFWNNFSTNTSTTSGNWILNPAVIPTTGNSTLMAYVDKTFIKSIGGSLDQGGNSGVYWAVNDAGGDPGNTTWPVLRGASSNGTVSFPEGHYGKIYDDGGWTTPYQSRIVVQGATAGRVRFNLQWSGNGTLAPFIGGNEEGTPLSHIKYEALVAPMLNLKYRVQRLVYHDDDGWHATPGAPSGDQIKAGIDVANVYLRQAGIQLVPDGNTGNLHVLDGESGLGNIHYTSVTGGNTSIFDVYVDPAVTNDYYALNTGYIDPFYVKKFLDNNFNDNVLQIVILGKTRPNGGKSGQTPTGETYFHHYNDTNFESADNTSQFDYIVSTNDTDSLAANHLLRIHSRSQSGLSPLPFWANFTGLCGTTLYSMDNHQLNLKNIFGQALAHEVGHVLMLNHREGYLHPSGDDQPDDVYAQKNAQGLSLAGKDSTNLMDYTNGSRIPEDLDLHQILIMRDHTGYTSGNVTVPAFLQPAE